MSAGNGQLPWSQLVYVGLSYDGAQAFLGDLTAASWLPMRAACLAESNVLLVISPNGGYRTLEQQALELGNGGAAVGSSTHGERQGSVDIWNWAQAWGWLKSRAADFGFVRDVDDENWHHHLVRALTVPAGSATPAPNKRKELLMRILVCDGQYYQIGAGYLAKPRDTAEGKNMMTALYGAPVPVSNDQLNEALTNHGIPWDVPGKLAAGLSWNRGQLQ